MYRSLAGGQRLLADGLRCATKRSRRAWRLSREISVLRLLALVLPQKCRHANPVLDEPLVSSPSWVFDLDNVTAVLSNDEIAGPNQAIMTIKPLRVVSQGHVSPPSRTVLRLCPR